MTGSCFTNASDVGVRRAFTMQKDDATWLNVAYVCFLLLISFVAYKLIETVGIQFDWTERYDEWFPTASTIAAVVIGVGGTWWLRADKERHEYFLASIAELRKVTWPSWADIKRMTLIVCVVVVIFAVILAIFDIIWARALKMLLA
jgi:preprotein translocase SecE subunit